MQSAEPSKDRGEAKRSPQGSKALQRSSRIRRPAKWTEREMTGTLPQ